MNTAIEAIQFLLYLAGREIGMTRYNYRVAAFRLIEEMEGYTTEDKSRVFGLGFGIDDGTAEIDIRVIPMIKAEHWHTFGWAIGEVWGEMTYYIPTYIPNWYGTQARLEELISEAIVDHCFGN
jgi:hypothetical protein